MKTPVESSLFHTANLAPEKRFEAWQESIGVMFDVQIDPRIAAKDFNARVASVLMDGVMLTRVKAGAQKFNRGAERILSDSIDHFMFQLFRGGHVDMRVGSKALTGPTGALVGFDLASILDSENSRFDVLTAIVPRTRLEPHLRNPGAVNGQILNPEHGAPRLVADYLETLCEVGAEMSADEAASAIDALIILLAAAFNQMPANENDPPDWADQALLIRINAAINTYLSDPELSADSLAVILGLSRSRLYKLFQPYGGIMNIVRERRLKRALTLVVKPHRQALQLSEIAYQCGFSGPAQFSRAFRAKFGCTPREARAQGGHASARRQVTTLSDIGDRKYEHWIETIG